MKKGAAQGEVAVSKFNPNDEIDLRQQKMDNAFGIRP